LADRLGGKVQLADPSQKHKKPLIRVNERYHKKARRVFTKNRWAKGAERSEERKCRRTAEQGQEYEKAVTESQ